MTKELEEKLVEKYPSILRDYGASPEESCMAWGFEHSDGWNDLVDNLLSELQKTSEEYGVEVVADQIKQKYGELRFYFHLKGEEEKIEKAKDKVYALINSAESLSVKTCETCGKPGELRTDRFWWNTICDNCDQLRPKGGTE